MRGTQAERRTGGCARGAARPTNVGGGGGGTPTTHAGRRGRGTPTAGQQRPPPPLAGGPDPRHAAPRCTRPSPRGEGGGEGCARPAAATARPAWRRRPRGRDACATRQAAEGGGSVWHRLGGRRGGRGRRRGARGPSWHTSAHPLASPREHPLINRAPRRQSRARPRQGDTRFVFLISVGPAITPLVQHTAAFRCDSFRPRQRHKQPARHTESKGQRDCT